MSRILKWIQAHHNRARTQPSNSAEGAKTSHEDQEFCYQPLETEDTIRLVFVYPGTEDTGVSFDIHHIALSQGSSYIAVICIEESSQKKKKERRPILFNGRRSSVTEELLAFFSPECASQLRFLPYTRQGIRSRAILD
jgi:hypothetical protein